MNKHSLSRRAKRYLHFGVVELLQLGLLLTVDSFSARRRVKEESRSSIFGETPNLVEESS
jgi:hypothetical protein